MTKKAEMEGLTYHDRPCHQQRTTMAELPKLLPVVLMAVQLPILLIVPVGAGGGWMGGRRALVS